MTNWRMHAACRDHDPELFHPVGVSGPAVLQELEAKKVCADCPVQRECLRFALDSGQEFGVWGGASEQDRRDMLRKVTVRRDAA